ncbi:MAG: RHS repeat domain-containing protein [Myxococcota bacterium]
MQKFLYCALVGGCLHSAEARATVEIQTHYNEAGQLTEESFTTDGVLTQLSRYQYDGLGRKTELRTDRQGRVTREVTVYLQTGRVGQTELWADELLVFRQTFLYQDGLLKSTTVEHRGSDVRTTEYSYDSFARPVRTITRDQSGKVLAQEVATFPLPRVPLELELEGGLSYQSDIKVLDLEGGLTLRRNPHGAERAHDPLEMEASVSYRFSHTKEAVENSHLDAQYNLNYLFAPRAE